MGDDLIDWGVSRFPSSGWKVDIESFEKFDTEFSSFHCNCREH